MINGQHLDWEDIQIMTPGGTMIMAKNINYEDSRPVEAARDNKGKKSGRIRKGYEASGDIELTRGEADRLVSALGSGYMGKVEFSVSVAGGNDGSEISFSDQLNECVIVAKKHTNSQESESLVGFDFDIKEIISNGVKPVV